VKRYRSETIIFDEDIAKELSSLKNPYKIFKTLSKQAIIVDSTHARVSIASIL